MSEFVDLGSARLDPQTNALLVQGKTGPCGTDENDAPDLGDAPIMCALGVTSLPWPSNDNGRAQGIKLDVPGTNGVVVGARDTRSAKVVAEMSAGESSLHSTGPDFDSRFFAKDQLAAIVVGDDMAFSMDRKEKQITISAFGCHFELSEANGIVLMAGGAMLQLHAGVASLVGQVVLGGRNPVQPMLMGPGGPATVAVPGVFAGA
jgi:hypothetical protein